jgi:hypothetical protein
MKPAVAVVDEYRGSDLGDARLDARLEKIGKRLAENPSAGFPTALVTSAEVEGFYRFIANPKVDLDGVLGPHKRATWARCAAEQEVIVAIDKSEMAFRGDRWDDLEALSSTTSGFRAFFALAMTRDRTPLGVLDILPLDESSGRGRATQWVECVGRVQEGLPTSVRAIYVMDREADAFELLGSLIKAGRSFVVRAKYDRLLAEGADTLKGVTSRQPLRLEREVDLSRRSGKGKPPDAVRRHPPRNGRVARLEVRACCVTLPRPPKAPGGLPTAIDVNVIHVTEPNPPTGEAPVEWLLLTREPIDTVEQVERAIDAYRARWLIEEFFKALKTGCAYEDRQLEGRHALLVTLGLLTPIAWQLLLLRAVSRKTPHADAERVLTPLQIRLLQLSEDTKLGPNPTLLQALLVIARLGGHMKQNGPPGWLTLWRGFEKLRAWQEGYLLANAAMTSDQS